jgi:hypothetical protein
MSEEFASNDFEASIDFEGRPLLSRTTSDYNLYGYGYGYMTIPSHFYSPAMTSYSAEEYVGSGYSPSENVSCLKNSGVLRCY